MFWITTKATPEPFLWELATVGTMIPTFVGWSATGKVNFSLVDRWILPVVFRITSNE